MLLKDKKILVLGIANANSIAYMAAKLAKENGAKLALTYPNDVLGKRVLPISEELQADMTHQCDVSSQGSIENLFEAIKAKWGSLDGIIHAVAYSDKNELKGKLLDTTLNNFTNSMHISCYSLINICRSAQEIMNEGGSIVTFSYYGSQKVIPNYNIMGVAKAALESSVKYLASDLGYKNIRVNAISAGPIKTLAASAIGDFKSMLQTHQRTSPLERNTTTSDVGKSTVYLLSDLSSGVTGEVHYVDCGYNTVGISKNID